MTNQVTASPSPSNEDQNIDEIDKPKLTKIQIATIFGIFVIFILAAAAVFVLSISETYVSDDDKNVIVEHKTKTIDSVTKATQFAKTLPDFVDQTKFDGLSNKLFDRVYKELNIKNLTSTKMIEFTEKDYGGYKFMLEEAGKCATATNLITEKEKVMELLNGPFTLHNQELAKIEQPFIAAQSELNATMDEESAKKGRLSKSNVVIFANNITTMLIDYQTSIVTRADSFIQAYDKQKALKDSSKQSNLIAIIVIFVIGFVIIIILAASFICFQKGKMAANSFKRFINIMVGICGFLTAVFLIFALLVSIGKSPFSYDCQLKTQSSDSDGKFYSFDGGSTNIRLITNACEDGQKVFSKMNLNLNTDKIIGYWDGFKSIVESVASNILNIDIDLDVTTISNVVGGLDSQHQKFKNQKCLTGTLPGILGLFLDDIDKCRKALNALKDAAEKIDDNVKLLSQTINGLIQTYIVELKMLLELQLIQLIKNCHLLILAATCEFPRV
ncbi:unnamed protein product [Caenorhabditis angaria]|uniref:Uncharacterized protein n=1 Tax=Caenorhabditis angaria TaxID=860376 RepID=A0A9P1I873_9PELO|nr:unnamed protein product [Caenorhabditis angaria]